MYYKICGKKVVFFASPIAYWYCSIASVNCGMLVNHFHRPLLMLEKVVFNQRQLLCWNYISLKVSGCQVICFFSLSSSLWSNFTKISFKKIEVTRRNFRLLYWWISSSCSLWKRLKLISRAEYWRLGHNV